MSSKNAYKDKESLDRDISHKIFNLFEACQLGWCDCQTYHTSRGGLVT